MDITPGSIIFLTIRKEKPAARIFLSRMIAKFTKKEGQELEDVKVHSAIVYKRYGETYVRDMDKFGDDHYPIEEYLDLYKGRIELKLNPYFDQPWHILETFNFSCFLNEVKYDYVNTFVYQVVRRLTHKFIGRETTWSRMCAEDVQRQYNLLVPEFFETPEKTNPNEVFFKVANWISYNLDA